MPYHVDTVMAFMGNVLDMLFVSDFRYFLALGLVLTVMRFVFSLFMYNPYKK